MDFHGLLKQVQITLRIISSIFSGMPQQINALIGYVQCRLSLIGTLRISQLEAPLWPTSGLQCDASAMPKASSRVSFRKTGRMEKDLSNRGLKMSLTDNLSRVEVYSLINAL